MSSDIPLFESEAEIHEILAPIVDEIIEDIDDYSRKVIEIFYHDYYPRLYIRKYGLREMWEVTTEPVSDGFYITFTYSDEFFSAEHRDDSAVFDLSFVEGKHGGPLAWGRPKSSIPTMSPSPWQLIEQYVQFYDVDTY